ncbi:MAG: hypothetical protein MUE73_21910 [Planctomycetes bacterium]|nr:hypothetical protein [Planctomycetota bacterium]
MDRPRITLDALETECAAPEPVAPERGPRRTYEDFLQDPPRHRFVMRSKGWSIFRAEVVFLLAALFFGMGGILGAAILAGVGLGIGILWYYLDAGPSLCAATGAPAFFLATAPFCPTHVLLFAILTTAGVAGLCLAAGGRRPRA